jgi:hypothetical protein
LSLRAYAISLARGFSSSRNSSFCAFLVDVETVLNNGRQFDLKSIVIHRLIAGDVQLQRGRLRSGEVAHGNRAKPQRADDFLQVRRDLLA